MCLQEVSSQTFRLSSKLGRLSLSFGATLYHLGRLDVAFAHGPTLLCSNNFQTPSQKLCIDDHIRIKHLGIFTWLYKTSVSFDQAKTPGLWQLVLKSLSYKLQRGNYFSKTVFVVLEYYGKIYLNTTSYSHIRKTFLFFTILPSPLTQNFYEIRVEVMCKFCFRKLLLCWWVFCGLFQAMNIKRISDK